MAVSVRLKRMGGKNDVCFRVVAADSRSPRDGRFIEQLGWYVPKRESNSVQLDLERIKYWKENGAQVSDTVRNLVKQVERSGMGKSAKAAPAEASEKEAEAPAADKIAEAAESEAEVEPEKPVASEANADEASA